MKNVGTSIWTTAYATASIWSTASLCFVKRRWHGKMSLLWMLWKEQWLRKLQKAQGAKTCQTPVPKQFWCHACIDKSKLLAVETGNIMAELRILLKYADWWFK
jgi:hypothetical protein